MLRSPPNVPAAGETSLATIQSQPLRVRFSIALATRFSVSAAKPTTRAGRFGPRLESVARMSGLGVSSSAGGAAPAFFLILTVAGLAIFQSATAAAQTATSTLPGGEAGGQHLVGRVDLHDRHARPDRARRPAR